MRWRARRSSSSPLQRHDDEARFHVARESTSGFLRNGHNNDGSRVFRALTSAGSVTWAVFLFRLSRLAPRFPRPLRGGEVGVHAALRRGVVRSWSARGGMPVESRRLSWGRGGKAAPLARVSGARGVDGVHGGWPRVVLRVVANRRASLRLGATRGGAHVHDAALGRGVGVRDDGRDHGLGGLGRGSDHRRRHRARRARIIDERSKASRRGNRFFLASRDRRKHRARSRARRAGSLAPHRTRCWI